MVKACCLNFLTIRDAAYMRLLLLLSKTSPQSQPLLIPAALGKWGGYEMLVSGTPTAGLGSSCPVGRAMRYCIKRSGVVEIEILGFLIGNQKHNPSNSSNRITDLKFPQKDILSCVSLLSHQSTQHCPCSQLFSPGTCLR